MRKQIIVGVDGSSQAADAMALAVRLAQGSGAAIMLGFIYNQEPTAETQDRAYRRELRDRSVAILGSARELIPPDIDVETGAFPANTTAHGLRDLAIDAGADLIVLGSTHYSPLGRVLIGGVGELLCSDAPCAVAVAPRGLSDGDQVPMERIGVAFDGSDQSSVALVEALWLADTFGAALSVLTVEHGKHFSSGGKHGALADASDHLSEVLEEVKPQAPVEHIVKRGDAAKELANAAQQLDLLVVGSRGYGPIRHALLGGVSGKLMSSVPCPIVVVPGEQGQRLAADPDAAPAAKPRD